jgi:hypothetical protein
MRSAGSKRAKKSFKKGNEVLAAWRPGEWYAGSVSDASSDKVIVDFEDDDSKQYIKDIYARVLRVKAPLPFNRWNCGPYSLDHAKVLVGLQQVSWPRRSSWVAVETDDGAWYIGRVTKLNIGTPECHVCLNRGGRLKCQWPQRVVYIPEADNPHVLSGPYEEDTIIRMMGAHPKSPLPRTKKRAPPRIAQRIIGSAPEFFDGWCTGAIEVAPMPGTTGRLS